MAARWGPVFDLRYPESVLSYNARRTAMKAEGIAWARDWRERNRATFDALYPETVEVAGE